MTLVSSAIGIGGTLITPLLAFSVHTWGWRWGAFLSGLGLILIGVPVALFVKRSPESMGMLPDGAAPSAGQRDQHSKAPDAKESPSQNREAEFTLKQAMRTSAFWMIDTGHHHPRRGVQCHHRAFYSDHGVARRIEQRAAALLAAMALMSLPSHLLVGWIADHVSKPRLMGLA